MSKDPPSGCSAGPVGDDSKFPESLSHVLHNLSDNCSCRQYYKGCCNSEKFILKHIYTVGKNMTLF